MNSRAANIEMEILRSRLPAVVVRKFPRSKLLFHIVDIATMEPRDRKLAIALFN